MRRPINSHPVEMHARHREVRRLTRILPSRSTMMLHAIVLQRSRQRRKTHLVALVAAVKKNQNVVEVRSLQRKMFDLMAVEVLHRRVQHWRRSRRPASKLRRRVPTLSLWSDERAPLRGSGGLVARSCAGVPCSSFLDLRTPLRTVCHT